MIHSVLTYSIHLKKENFYNPISPHFGKPLTLLFGESDDEKDNYHKKKKKYDEEESNENE